MAEIILLSGSNLGDRHSFINNAEKRINEMIGVINKRSSVYETEPWGFRTGHLFLNQVVIVKSDYNPHEVLKKIKVIEKESGRGKSAGSYYESRTIDIDILFYECHIIKTHDLEIPHPRLHERRFTLVPLNEIMPGFVHPVFNITIHQLLKKCKDKSWVKKIGG